MKTNRLLIALVLLGALLLASCSSRALWVYRRPVDLFPSHLLLDRIGADDGNPF